MYPYKLEDLYRKRQSNIVEHNSLFTYNSLVCEIEEGAKGLIQVVSSLSESVG